jgi:spore germination protein
VYRQARYLALATAVALVLAAPPPATGKPSRSSAWIPWWRQAAATRAVTAHPGLLASASPFWFYTDEEGALRAKPGAGDPEVLDALDRAGIPVIPTVTTLMSPAKATAILGDADSRSEHVSALVDLARPYDGLDLDYEQQARTVDPTVARQVRPAFNRFVAALCPALRAEGLACVVTVMPRTGRRLRTWRNRLIPWIYDYARLGKAADRLRVMAYDQHAPGTLPGPIAGAPWVRKVARFTARQVRPRKVQLGIPLYGRDWVRGTTEAEALTWDKANSLRLSVGADYRWARRQRAPWFRYPDHVVWYSDWKSTLARARIARRFGFPGAALWAPGGEDPRTWRALRLAYRRGS